MMGRILRFAQNDTEAQNGTEAQDTGKRKETEEETWLN